MFAIAITALSGCSQRIHKPESQFWDTTQVKSQDRIDQADPLVYCGGNGPFRCPSTTDKTPIAKVDPAPAGQGLFDPKTAVKDAAAAMLIAAAAPAPVADLALANVLFDFDKSVITPPALQQLTADLPKLKGKQIQLVGFTDAKGTESYNQRLAERRATSVRNQLIKLGIDPAAIQASGKGDCCFVAGNTTDADRQLNRRVEIRLVKQP